MLNKNFISHLLLSFCLMQYNPDQTCIILAGGLGTRLAPILNGKPKCLAQINNKNFLKILLKSLWIRGIEKFILALGYGSQEVIDEIKKPWTKNFKIKYIVEEKKLGTGGAIKNALKEVDNDECIVLNGDTLITGNINVMKTKLDTNNSELVRIGLLKVSNSSRYGGVKIDKQSFITDFIEKGLTNESLINTGLYRIHKSIFKNINSEIFSFEEFISKEVKKNKSTKGAILTGSFIDIGIPEDYKFLCEHERDYA